MIPIITDNGTFFSGLSIRFVTFPIIKYPSKANNMPGIAKSDFTEKITGEEFCHKFPFQYWFVHKPPWWEELTIPPIIPKITTKKIGKNFAQVRK